MKEMANKLCDMASDVLDHLMGLQADARDDQLRSWIMTAITEDMMLHRTLERLEEGEAVDSVVEDLKGLLASLDKLKTNKPPKQRTKTITDFGEEA